jgi:hypothetical protein
LSEVPRRDSKLTNIHVVNPEIKIHTVVSAELDFDHEAAMVLPLGEVSDEQLLAEVARRRLDLHDKITDSLVKETYDFGKILGKIVLLKMDSTLTFFQGMAHLVKWFS